MTDAKGPWPCAKWGEGIDRQFASPGITISFNFVVQGLLTRVAALGRCLRQYAEPGRACT